MTDFYIQIAQLIVLILILLVELSVPRLLVRICESILVSGIGNTDLTLPGHGQCHVLQHRVARVRAQLRAQ